VVAFTVAGTDLIASATHGDVDADGCTAA